MRVGSDKRCQRATSRGLGDHPCARLPRGGPTGANLFTASCSKHPPQDIAASDVKANLARAALLFGYGVFVNLPPVEFGRVAGLYIGTLFVLWQIVDFSVFGAVPSPPILLGRLRGADAQAAKSL